LRLRLGALPFAGAASFTPARRALDRPIAVACFAERAPCFRSRTCAISSRTNSASCVEADLPRRCEDRDPAAARGLAGQALAERECPGDVVPGLEPARRDQDYSVPSLA
jgi:hypothetical protein